MKTGLVLEGGGMRGIYTAGVLDAFMEHGIEFDGVIGVSAGAIHGCSFVSKQKGRIFPLQGHERRDRYAPGVSIIAAGIPSGRIPGKEISGWRLL